MRDRELTENAELTEKEELLLIKYSDNECGFLEKLFARRLISHKPAARSFFQSLQVLSDEFSAARSGSEELKVDLWSRILNRIDQEEKAEFYLGARDASEKKQPQHFWSSFDAVLGGQIAAAVLAVFIFYGALTGSITPAIFGGQDENPSSASLNLIESSNSSVAALSNPNIRQVSSGSRSLSADQLRPKFDWIRSHAKVRMIKEDGRRLPIIWVKRSLPEEVPARVMPSRSERLLQSLPVEALDARLMNSISDTPILLDERAPQSLGVISRRSGNK